MDATVEIVSRTVGISVSTAIGFHIIGTFGAIGIRPVTAGKFLREAAFGTRSFERVTISVLAYPLYSFWIP